MSESQQVQPLQVELPMFIQQSAAMKNIDCQNEHQLTQQQQQNLQQMYRTAFDNMAIRDFECACCGRRFPTKEYLENHLIPDKKKCQICCKRFRHISNLVNHKRVHTGEKPYVCHTCHKAFAQSGNLRTHVRSVHSRDMPYACDVCHRKFTQIGNLKAHKRIHSVLRPYACDKCSETYCQLKNLIKHKKKKH